MMTKISILLSIVVMVSGLVLFALVRVRAVGLRYIEITGEKTTFLAFYVPQTHLEIE